MKVMAIGDPHTSATDQFNPIEGSKFNRREEMFLDTFEWAGRLARENEVDVAVFMGDYQEKKDVVDTPSLSLLGRCLDSFRNEYSGDVVFNIGNHDWYSTSGLHHVASVLWGFGLIIEEITSYEGEFWICPYGREDREKMSSGVWFTHMDVKGARYTEYYESDAGWEFNAGVRRPRIFNGHIHHPGQYGEVLNVGAPVFHSFKDLYEKDNPRGVWLIEIKGGRVKSWKKVANPNVIPYRKVVVHSKEDVRKIQREFKQADSYLNIQTELPWEEVAELPSMGMVVRSLPRETEQTETDISDVSAWTPQTMTQIYVRMVKGADTGHMDKKMLATIGKEALNDRL